MAAGSSAPARRFCTSIAFCNSEMIERFRKIGLIQDYVEQRIADVVALRRP